VVVHTLARVGLDTVVVQAVVVNIRAWDDIIR